MFSKTYPSFLTVKEGSTSHPAPLSSGAMEETALLGAQNRYALRLADQSGLRHVLQDGTAWGINNDGKATSQLQRRHCSIPSLQKSLVVSLFICIKVSTSFIKRRYASIRVHINIIIITIIIVCHLTCSIETPIGMFILIFLIFII